MVLPIVWDEGKSASASQAGIEKMLRDGLDEQGDFWQRKVGDAPRLLIVPIKKWRQFITRHLEPTSRWSP